MNIAVKDSHRTLRQLWQLTDTQRPLFGAAAIAMLMANLCLFVPPLLGKFAIDLVTDQSSEPDMGKQLWLYGIGSVLVTLVAGSFQYARGRCTALASEGVAKRLRTSLYDKLHANTARFFDQEQTGDLVQRCSSDVETVRVFLAANLVDITRSLVLLVGVVPVLFWINSSLAWWSLCLMPLLVVGSAVFFAHAKRLFLLADEAEGRMTSCLQENLTGIRVVRAFNRQDFEIDKFAMFNGEFKRCNYRLMSVMSYFWGLSDLISFTQLGIVLVVGASMVQSDSLSLGDLFAFMTYVGMVIWPLRHLGRVLVDSGKSMVALNRINHILAQPDEPAGIEPAVAHAVAHAVEPAPVTRLAPALVHAPARASGSLIINDLTMAYPGTENSPALAGITLEIAPGETIALVGAPGSGKTSLMAVLLKLYAYQDGSVNIDGHELRDLDRHWLRQQFSVVFQEPFLFSRTLEQNLMVGNGQATDERLQDTCREAALHESILGFKDQYQSLIGERGVMLSGGQRQRLALARALLKEAPFLLLDDALSAVDSDTEKTILTALESRRGKQTTIIAAHRLSTIRHADRIVFLERGEIVQLGTHDQLADQPGAYQQLCNIQDSLDAAIETELNSAKVSS